MPKVGEKVRIVTLPPGLRDDAELQTKSLFEACLGLTFEIVSLDLADDGSCRTVELHVGHVVGEESFVHSIWVEPEHLEPVL